MELMELTEVDWYVPPLNEWDMPSYRKCDLCFEDASCDVVAGKKAADLRRFWYDKTNGLSVCEHCIDAYLKELP